MANLWGDDAKTSKSFDRHNRKSFAVWRICFSSSKAKAFCYDFRAFYGTEHILRWTA